MEDSHDEKEEPSGENIFPILTKKDAGPPSVVLLTKQERDMIDAYTQTGSFDAVARELHVAPQDVSAFLKRADIQEYIKERLRNVANKYDLTPEKIFMKLNEVIEDEGKTKYNSSYMKALDLASRILKLIQPNSTVIQNSMVQNPYEKLSDDDLNEVIKGRLGHGI